MIQVSIINQGKVLSPKDLTSPVQLRAAVAQARTLIVECEKMLQAKPDGEKGPNQGGIPYLS